MPIQVLETIVETRAFVRAERARGARIGLVPTMGALHDGHAALVEAALASADAVVASVFVNPTQFGPGEDLARYPRTPEADIARLEALGARAVFMPSEREMYPNGAVATTVTAGPIGAVLEGESRPGHYDGVLTVVAKLYSIVLPDAAAFGEKDAQQLFLVQQMVADLNLPVQILGVPTVREPDGLALSSRNQLLSETERQEALALSKALGAAARERDPSAMRAAALEVLEASAATTDYVAVVDPETFLPPTPDYSGPVRVLVAARVGNVRLIDNALL